MTRSEHMEALADPFGTTVGEGVWRRLAGAGVAVTVAAAGSVAWTTDVRSWVLLGAGIVYLAGVPALVRWPCAAIGRAELRRHCSISGTTRGALSWVKRAPRGCWGRSSTG